LKTNLPNEKVLILARSVFDKMGAKIETYQEDVILDNAKNCIINKARGIGITFAIAFKILLLALTNKSKEFIIVSQRKEAAEHVLKYIIDFYEVLKTAPILFPKIVNAGASMVAFDNGCMIISLPSTPDALRTYHGFVYWDESAFHPNDKDLHKAIRGCLMPSYPWWVSSTPNEQSGVFHDVWANYSENIWKKYELPYTVSTNPEYIKSVLLQKEEAERQGLIDSWLQEFMCKFIDGKTRLFPWDLIALNIEKDFPKVETEFAGIDFGKRVDNSQMVSIGKDKYDSVRITNMQEYALGQQYETQTNSMIKYLANLNTLNKVFLDATGVGVSLDEKFHNSEIGYQTQGINFSNIIKEKMAMFLYSLLNSEKIKLPNDETLLKQIYGIRRTTTESGLSRYKHEEGKHDDKFWALCLALMGYIDGESEVTEDSVQIGGKGIMTFDNNALSELKNIVKGGF
jgi:phage FluMu gp28-like protein